MPARRRNSTRQNVATARTIIFHMGRAYTSGARGLGCAAAAARGLSDAAVAHEPPDGIGHDLVAVGGRVDAVGLEELRVAVEPGAQIDEVERRIKDKLQQRDEL